MSRRQSVNGGAEGEKIHQRDDGTGVWVTEAALTMAVASSGGGISSDRSRTLVGMLPVRCPVSGECARCAGRVEAVALTTSLDPSSP